MEYHLDTKTNKEYICEWIQLIQTVPESECYHYGFQFHNQFIEISVGNYVAY